jgi:peptidoglycan/xylan/chitin deacetylase (PgdA/CDA1 family)
MSAGAPERWPDGARAAVSVTFDNLGEAAEQELGMPTPSGGHHSVTTALPIVLAELAEAGVRATFFVEGVNTETYPDALRSVVGAGHECGYHAWRHEDWSRLTAAEEQQNLRRGVQAMRSRGLDPEGFRPPGGVLGARTLELLQAHGLSYCSPAGAGVAIERTVLLPFAWRSVDAYHLLPQFAALRSHIDGSDEPGGPERVAETLIAAIDDAIATAAHATLVLHTWLIEAERDAVRAVLSHVQAGARRGDVWSARCDEVAQWIMQHPDSFTDAASLDETSWLDPATEGLAARRRSRSPSIHARATSGGVMKPEQRR